MIARILLLLLCVSFVTVAPTAKAGDGASNLPKTVVIRKDPAAGTDRYIVMHRFGNRNRIAKLAAPGVVDRSGQWILIKDPVGRTTYQEIKPLGNRNRIALRIDPAVKDLTGRVITVKDRYGEPALRAMKRFGNRHRIQKLLGAD